MINFIMKLIKWWLTPKTIPVVVPKASPNDVLVHEAQDWVGTLDTADHTNAQVNAFREAVNAHPSGENWCSDFVIFCIEQVEAKLGVVSDLYLHSELAQDLWWKSPVTCRVPSPFPGAIIVWKEGNTGLGHCGVVEAVAKDGTLTTIEGNTGPVPNAIIRDGGGVYRRLRTQTGTATMSVIGFLKPFNT